MSSVCVKGSPGALNWNWTGSHIKNCWWFWFWLFPREVAGINSVSLERCISINGQEQTDCGDTNQNCLWFKNFCFPINRSWERGATGFPILFLLRDGTTLKSKLTAATQIRTFLFITKKKSLVQHEVDDNAEEDLKRFLCYWRDRERERDLTSTIRKGPPAARISTTNFPRVKRLLEREESCSSFTHVLESTSYLYVSLSPSPNQKLLAVTTGRN